jgi:hypothetical protein
MVEELEDGDAVAARAGKIGQSGADRRVEIEPSFLGELQDQHRGEQFGDRGDSIAGVRRRRHGEGAVGRSEAAAIERAAARADQDGAAEIVRAGEGVDRRRQPRRRCRRRRGGHQQQGEEGEELAAQRFVQHTAQVL